MDAEASATGEDHETASPAAADGSVGSVLSLDSVGSALSIDAIGSVLSIRSIGAALSIGSIGSLLSVGSIGSALSIGSIGSFLSIGSIGSVLSIGSIGGDHSVAVVNTGADRCADPGAYGGPRLDPGAVRLGRFLAWSALASLAVGTPRSRPQTHARH